MEIEKRGRLTGTWLRLGRALWLLVAALAVVVYLVYIVPFNAFLHTLCQVNPCPTNQLTAQGLSLLQRQGLSVDFYAGFMLVCQLVVWLGTILIGIWIFFHRQDDWMALLASLLFVVMGTPDDTRLVSGALPLLTPVIYLLNFCRLALWILFLYLFPDGQFEPRWSWSVVPVWILANLPRLWPDSPLNPALHPVWDSLLWYGINASGIIALGYRYLRKAGPHQRQQMKWLVYVVVIYLLAAVPLDAVSPPPGSVLFFVSQGVLLVFSVLIPTVVALAILRYRLWDIDFIIRKTLVYGILTASLGLVYLGSVIALQRLFEVVTGQGSPLTVVISTLLIASLFEPIRRWAQTFIDRRFYRQKYDAARALETFASAARGEVKLDSLATKIAGVVSQTFQPESVWVWIKKEDKSEKNYE